MNMVSQYPHFELIFLSPYDSFNSLSRLYKAKGENIEKEFPMSNQILTQPVILSNFVFSLPSANTAYSQPFFASSLDYGFDFDEEELANGLLAPLPAGLSNQPIPHVEPEEFESLYRWFNS